MHSAANWLLDPLRRNLFREHPTGGTADSFRARTATRSPRTSTDGLLYPEYALPIRLVAVCDSIPLPEESLTHSLEVLDAKASW